MNGAPSGPRNSRPYTDQAATGTGDEDFIAGTTEDDLIAEEDMGTGFPAADAGPPTSSSADAAPGTQLFGTKERETIVTRWREIQAEFVDEPRVAIQEADELVTGLIERLSRAFARERDQLESRWADGEDVSTEDLRQGLQHYRSFFERLLAA